MSTGCYGYVRDCDVGVIMRLELGLITIRVGMNAKRAEVAASDRCAGKSNCGREARPTDLRGGNLFWCRRVSTCEQSGNSYHCDQDSMRAKPGRARHTVLLGEQ